MQRTQGQFGIGVRNEDADLDLRCGNHLDIDAFIGQRLEHPHGNTRMAAHTDANHRNLNNIGISDNGFVTDLCLQSIEQRRGPLNEVGRPAAAEGDVIVAEADVVNIDISTASGAQSGLQVITDAIEQVAGDRATYGALQNRLEYTVSNLMNVAEFTTAARSRIEDADFAAESARLAKAQVLQQTGTAMLAQANASSQLALSLIR